MAAKRPATGTTNFYKIGREKMSKPAAGYRDSTGNIHCKDCVHMNRDGSCQIVAGQVKPNYVCDYYEPEHEPRD